MKPDDSEVPQLRRLQDWWLELPLSYRLNALLYFLGLCFMVFLLTTVLGGGDTPRQIQVGAGATTSSAPTTTRTVVTAPTSSTPASSTSSTGPTTTAGGATTTRAPGATTPAPTAVPTTVPTTEAATTTVANTVGTTPATTTTKPPCRNSTDPACGQFQWSPGPNSQPLSVGPPEVTPASPQPNATVTFKITVTDPDHTIGTCATLDFGDLSTEGSCPEPPCPARYGTWDLPAAGGPGSFTFTFTHVYKAAGPFIATFLVDDRGDCWDPYGERRTRPIAIVVG